MTGLTTSRSTLKGRQRSPPAPSSKSYWHLFEFAGLDNIDVSREQEFRNQGYTRDQIDSAWLESFSLTVDSPAGGNFDWLDRISFYAAAEGEAEVEIARLDPVPVNSTTLELETLDVDLTPYVTAESMTVRTVASGRRPSEETTVRARLRIAVDVDVSSACSVGDNSFRAGR